jgi:hypothetical protein
LADLRVVSERSAEEIKKQEATQALKAALVNLTGNLIRVVRGAGKPDRIIEQLHAVAVSYTEYSDAHGGEADSSVYREMLRFETPELPERDDRARAVLAEHAICRTALQVVASTMLEQERQQLNALGELRNRLREAEERLFTERKERARAVRKAQKARRDLLTR